MSNGDPPGGFAPAGGDPVDAAVVRRQDIADVGWPARWVVDADGKRVDVIVGADDRHPRFRSCVGVALRADGRAVVTLGTRVQTTDRFGRAYMAAIDRVHRACITPALLRLALDYAVRRTGVDSVASPPVATAIR